MENNAYLCSCVWPEEALRVIDSNISNTKYGKGKTDTGSPEAQIALFSVRIAHLTQHLKTNHKDHTTERALKMLVGKRRRLLDYLKRKDISRYRAIIAQKELGIRK